MKWPLLIVRLSFALSFVSWWRESDGLWSIVGLALDTRTRLAWCILLGLAASLWPRAHGYISAACFALSTACYWMIVQHAQPFSSFQWDALLLECGYMAPLVAFAPRMRSPLVLVEALAFRLMFASGAVKLHGCPAWGSWMAMLLHFETQPLPNPLSWRAHKFVTDDMVVGAAASLATFWIEICLPFFFVLPYFSSSRLALQLRKLAAGANICLMGAIALTGNYNFFNLLTVGVLLVPLLHDVQPVRALRSPLVGNAVASAGIVYVVYLMLAVAQRTGQASHILSVANRVGLVLYAVLVVIHVVSDLVAPKRHWFGVRAAVALAVLALFALSLPSWPRADPTGATATALRPATERLAPYQWLQASSPYGLFSYMTTERPELLVESSMDGSSWSSYHFRYKPDARLKRMPPQIAPFQPRLDWQLWFEAMRSQPSPWMFAFLKHLMVGTPGVVGLVEKAPHKQPKYIRYRKVYYRFDMNPEGTAYWQVDRQSSRKSETSKSYTLDQIRKLAPQESSPSPSPSSEKHWLLDDRMLEFFNAHAQYVVLFVLAWIALRWE